MARDTILTDLVERQMRNWELARSQKFTPETKRRREVEDFLCVSRMVGIDGRRLARRLGRELGWPVFDRDLLDKMAGDDRVRRRLYAQMDERDLGWWEKVIWPLLQGEFLRDDYFHRLCDTVLALARQAPGVFVGRGADLILPAGHGCRVRLVASRSFRVAAYARRRGLSEKDAARELAQLEAERGRFFAHHFQVEHDDPARADLAINVGRLDEARCVDLVTAVRAGTRCAAEGT